MSGALRPRKSSTTLRKKSARSAAVSGSSLIPSPPPSLLQTPLQPDRPLAPLEAHREKYKLVHSAVDAQLGERRDHTELLHALGRTEAFDSEPESDGGGADSRPRGDAGVASLSPELWDIVTEFLDPLDGAYLAIASRTLHAKLEPRPFRVLDRPENRRAKLGFLVAMDARLPHHLLCFACAQYHRRLQPGAERWLPTASQAAPPVYACPNARHRPQPRLPITQGRSLPFALAQLVMRRERRGAAYGVPVERLTKRWAHGAWEHSPRVLVLKGRLVRRVSSQAFATPNLTASGKRLLLFSRDEYEPYWSVCAHWKHGEMAAVAKCALDHVPAGAREAGLLRLETRIKTELEGIKGRHVAGGGSWASQCGECKPLRRCTECPTEYLVEVKLVEDRDQSKTRLKAAAPLGTTSLFKHALVVTRWSDLGEGKSPFEPEWAACAGTNEEPFDSFRVMHGRSLAAVFESAITEDKVPGQRILSLNPRGRRRTGDNEDSWY